MTDLQVPWVRSGVGETPAEGGCIMQIADWIYRHEWTDEPPCVHPIVRTLALRANDSLPDDERQQLLDLIPRMMNTASEDKALTKKLITQLARRVYPIYAEWARVANYHDGGALLACIEAAERGETAGMAGFAGAAWAQQAAKDNQAEVVAWGATLAAAASSTDRPREEAITHAQVAAARAAAEAAYAIGFLPAVVEDGGAAAASAAAAAVAEDGGAAAQLALLIDLLDHYDTLTDRTEVEPVDFAPVCEMLAGIESGAIPERYSGAVRPTSLSLPMGRTPPSESYCSCGATLRQGTVPEPDGRLIYWCMDPGCKGEFTGTRDERPKSSCCGLPMDLIPTKGRWKDVRAWFCPEHPRKPVPRPSDEPEPWTFERPDPINPPRRPERIYSGRDKGSGQGIPDPGHGSPYKGSR